MTNRGENPRNSGRSPHAPKGGWPGAHKLWLVVILGLIALAAIVLADPTVDSMNRLGYAGNAGWTNWRWDPSVPGEGAALGQFVTSGKVWASNFGWIDLGDGTPESGSFYANMQVGGVNDFGVNHLGNGELEGLAWSGNIGWIRFSQSWEYPPRIDLNSGKLSGYIWSANCGWFDLGTNGIFFVETELADPGPDTDGDGIPDPWELTQVLGAGMDTGTTAGNLALLSNGGADADLDGKSDVAEYIADSGAFDETDLFQVTQLAISYSPADDFTLEWTSTPTRIYRVWDLGNLLTDLPVLQYDNIPADAGISTSRSVSDALVPNPHLWQVEALVPALPLAP